eukprot:scaffold870_cov268-Pinguiococcus_pyrenoidosus.AAC.55
MVGAESQSVGGEKAGQYNATHENPYIPRLLSPNTRRRGAFYLRILNATVIAQYLKDDCHNLMSPMEWNVARMALHDWRRIQTVEKLPKTFESTPGRPAVKDPTKIPRILCFRNQLLDLAFYAEGASLVVFEACELLLDLQNSPLRGVGLVESPPCLSRV